jgi:UDP-glucuronate 4-epimerase
VDNLNDYYDVRLKDYRLSRLLDVSWPLSGARAVGGALRPDGFGLGSDPKRSAFAGNHQPATNNSGKFTFLPLDIENLPALEEVFAAHRKFDAVFNLAARAGVRYSLEFPELYRRTNVLGEENVLQCQVKYGVKKHGLASSSSVYAGCPMPFVEDAALGTMQSPYAETKRQAELLAKNFHEKHGLDVTVLRYFTVFGPAGRPDMSIFRFIKWIDEGKPLELFGDGSQSRDFTYVDDIARGTILAGKLFGGQMTERRRAAF